MTHNSTLTVAAVQAAYVLMDRDASIERVAALTADAVRNGAQLVVLPEAFIPGTPLWIDTRPIWDGDGDWYRLLVEQAVVVGDPACHGLAQIAADNGVWLVVGVQEREPTGATIFNTLLYFAPDGSLVQRHRKLVPTGSERTVWAGGDGSTLEAVDIGQGSADSSAGRTTCRWPGSTCMPRAWTSGSHRPWRAATAGSPRCSTLPVRTACTSWA